MDHESAKDYLVFISHSSMDTWVASQIAREVADCGAKTFLDEADIAVGADFEADILSHLEQAHELLVLLTPWALERAYVWAEIGAAWGRRIPIVALLHGLSPREVQSKAGVPNLLKSRNLIGLNEIDSYFDRAKGARGTRAELTEPHPMGNSVFISYPHTEAEQEWVEGFSKSLQAKGFNVWLDRWQLGVGEDIQAAIEKGLRESDNIVWVVNKDNVRSPNTLFELGAAAGMGKLGTVIISNEMDPALVPGILRSKRFLKRQSPEETANAFAAEASPKASEQRG